MPVIPSLQSLVGANSGGNSCAVDWGRNKVFEESSSNLSRYGLLTGLEEVFAPLTNYMTAPVTRAFIGLARNGNIFISGKGVYQALYLSGSDLSLINQIAYPSGNNGASGMVGISMGGNQFCIDKGVGNTVIPTLNQIQEISTNTWLATQDFVGGGGACCAGVAGTGVGFVLSPNTSGNGPIYLNKITFSGGGFSSNVTVGTISMASINGSWTGNFSINGVCLDQTDGKLLGIFTGTGGTNSAYLAKIDPTSAAVVWKSSIPNSSGGNPVLAGNTFSYSDIQHQRVAFFTPSPSTVTIYNTSDGSVSSTYTSGLNGISPRYEIGGMCYSDTLGAIVLCMDFAQTAGSPTLLNSTPTSWSAGYGVLYVAAGVTPPAAAGRRWNALIGPLNVAGSSPAIINQRVTMDGNVRVTNDGSIRITQ